MKLKNKKGASYILVIIIIFSVFFMLSLLMYITANKTKTTKSLIENDSMYYIALSGIEKTEQMLNNYINKNADSIRNKTLSEISNAEFYYKGVDFTKSYLGEFTFFKDNIYKDTYKKFAKEIVLDSVNSNFNLDYKITYENGVDGNYEVVVKLESIEEGFKIITEVRNLDNNNFFKLEGIIKYIFLDSEEIIIEKIKPLQIPEIFNLPFYANEKVFIHEEEFLQDEFSEQGNVFLNNMYLLNINKFKMENPIVVLYGSEEISVSEFYKSDSENVITYIINKDSDSNTIIRSDNLNKNIFSGIIISKGNIYIDEGVLVKGTIISEKNIFINGEIETSDRIFDILITDKMLRRKVSDFFELTDFIDVGGRSKVNINDFPNAKVEILGILVKDVGEYKLVN